jgi:hypothetical protein
MKTTTKIWLGIGACILTSVAGTTIASAKDRAVNQLISPTTSISNNNNIQSISLIASRNEQGEEQEEEREDHDRDRRHERHS